jgi:hypothetical protein
MGKRVENTDIIGEISEIGPCGEIPHHQEKTKEEERT